MSELIVRSTIEAIVARRNEALQLYEDAFRKIREASEVVKLADRSVLEACSGSRPNNYMQAPGRIVRGDRDQRQHASPDSREKGSSLSATCRRVEHERDADREPDDDGSRNSIRTQTRLRRKP